MNCYPTRGRHGTDFTIRPELRPLALPAPRPASPAQPAELVETDLNAVFADAATRVRPCTPTALPILPYPTYHSCPVLRVELGAEAVVPCPNFT